MDYIESLQFFRGKGLFLFDDLELKAQKRALNDVMGELTVYRFECFKNVRESFKKSMNQAINDKNHIKRLINNLQSYYKAKEKGDQYLTAYIRENLIWFTHEGVKADLFK